MAATYFTFNGTLARHHPLDPVILAVVVVLWIYSLIGVVGFWRRPDLSRLPPRPWTRPAGICAAFAALLLVIAFAVHLSANSSGAQWIAVVLALPAVPLFIAAPVLNNRPALVAPIHPGADMPGPPV